MKPCYILLHLHRIPLLYLPNNEIGSSIEASHISVSLVLRVQMGSSIGFRYVSHISVKSELKRTEVDLNRTYMKPLLDSIFTFTLFGDLERFLLMAETQYG